MGKVCGHSSGGVALRVAGVGLALLFAGCGGGGAEDGYDPALRYPLRADPLVLATPPAEPTAVAPSGKLDETIAAFGSHGGTLLSPAALPDSRREELRAALEGLFGTPAAPLAGPATDVGGLDLSPAHLAAGSRVYRRLCVNCHGMAGDGRGPTGPWVVPYPRDLRTGLFKVAEGGRKPRVEVLARQVRRGVPGTAMQPFDLIPEEEVRAVTAYAVHLSLRGEVEYRVTKALLDESGESDVSDVAAECRAVLEKLLGDWAKAQAAPPPAPAWPADPADPAHQEAVRRGQALFAGAAGCASCHKDYGRPDAFRYDVWGGVVRVPDLTRGEFRWGKQPADLVTRVRHGIPASGMPANEQLTDEQVRDVALFVSELAFPNRLPPDVRGQVYPADPASGGR
ncbi:MAG TPA: c-type cytochrome [Fimbriiglobus sp.]|jgi:mono/diheme cytochrome c family protein|nr:c-type cytochrome [Fimbriiglobus sp.]